MSSRPEQKFTKLSEFERGAEAMRQEALLMMDELITKHQTCSAADSDTRRTFNYIKKLIDRLYV